MNTRVITLEHVIPFAKDEEHTCMCGDGDFWGETRCHYLAYRTRTHGRRAPAERNLPKCTLFDKWLGYDGVRPAKCSECWEKCTK